MKSRNIGDGMMDDDDDDDDEKEQGEKQNEDVK